VSNTTWRSLREWALVGLVAIGFTILIWWYLPRPLAGAFSTAIPVLAMLYFVVMWVTSGATVLAIGVWAVPSAALIATWAIGFHGVWWLVAAASLGMYFVSCTHVVHNAYMRLVSRVGRSLMIRSLSPADRRLEVTTESLMRRVGDLMRDADAGLDQYIAGLEGVRLEADGLPTDSLVGAKLRRSLLHAIDGHLDHASGRQQLTSDANQAANATLLESVQQLRSRSRLYRVMTWTWKRESRDITADPGDEVDH